MSLTSEDIKRYAELDQELDVLDAREKEIKREMKMLDERIIQSAEWNGVFKFETPEGRFEVEGVNHFKTLKQNKLELIERWKKDEVLKAFVVETIHAAALKAEAKRQFEKDFKSPDLVDLYSTIEVKFKPTIKRKRKKKKEEDTEE